MKKRILSYPLMAIICYSTILIILPLLYSGIIDLFREIFKYFADSFVIVFGNIFLIVVYSFVVLILTLVAIFLYDFFCLPNVITDSGIKHGKEFIAWEEITGCGVAELFPRTIDFDKITVPGKTGKYIYLSVGKTSPDLWQIFAISGVWEVVYTRKKYPHIVSILTKIFETGEKSNNKPRNNTWREKIDTDYYIFPEKMVWFKYDVQLHSECSKYIGQKTEQTQGDGSVVLRDELKCVCQGDGSLDTP